MINIVFVIYLTQYQCLSSVLTKIKIHILEPTRRQIVDTILAMYIT